MRILMFVLICITCSCTNKVNRAKTDDFNNIVDILLRFKFNDADMVFVETSKVEIHRKDGGRNGVSKEMFDRLAEKNFLSKDDARFMIEHVDTSSIYIDITKIDVKYMHESKWRNMVDKMDLDSAYQSLRDELKVYKFIRISTPIFSEDRSKVFLFVDEHCGGLCGQGHQVLLVRRNGKWRILFDWGTWVS